MLFPKFITTKFYNKINSEFPASQEDVILRRFIMYLALGSCYDRNYQYLRLSQFICAILEKKSLNGHYVARDFIDTMMAHIPGLVVNGWTHNGLEQEEQYLNDNDFNKDCSRLVIDNGFSESFKLAIEEEKKDILLAPKTGLVHYATGSKFNRIRHKAQMEQESEQDSEVLTKACTSVTDLQKKFLNYFNSLDTNSFSKIIDKNLQETIELAQTFNFTNESVRDRNFKLLDAIKMQPKPYYYAVDKSRRLYGLGSCIPYLKKELRRCLTKGWIEFDICNCHLAIIAIDWHIHELRDLLKTTSIWTYLSDYYDVESGKPILKKAIYALVYGDSKTQIKADLKAGGMTEKQAEQFFKVPMIEKIYKSRQRQLKICTTLPTDCFGERIEVEMPRFAHDQKPARSILAQKAHAVELRMLEPIVDFSKENENVMIACLYQFDGFSAVCKQPSRMETHCHKLKKILDNHIKEMGYETFVEYKINQ